MIGIWDLGFFLGFFLVTVGAVYFHWATATHGVRRRRLSRGKLLGLLRHSQKG